MEKVLPKGWVETELGDVTTKPQYGWTTKSTNDGEYKYLRTTDIGKGCVDWDRVPFCQYVPDDVEKYLLEENDILISRAGSIGLSYLVGSTVENCLFASYLIRFKPFIVPKFISYYLNSMDYWKAISNNAVGIAVQNINAPKLQAIPFPLPPLLEQERIVAKLDKLFAQHEKIKKALDRIPQLLKTFRQQVLTQAVTGKLTEQWRENCRPIVIDESSLTQILEREVALLNEEHSKAGKSKIKINPILLINNNKIGWPIYTLESVCVVIVDCLHETAKFSNSEFPIIDTNNIEPFRINKNKLRFVDSNIYDKWISRLKPKRGDLAYTREGSIGSAVLIPDDDKYCIGQRTMLFRFSGLLNPSFCEMYINSQVFKSMVQPFIKGVASQHVNIRDLRTLEIPVPSLDEQQEIVRRVESLFAKADSIESRYQTLKAKIDTLPQAILHKAFKGELVPQLPNDGDAKELLEEIMALKAEPKGKKRK